MLKRALPENSLILKYYTGLIYYFIADCVFMRANINILYVMKTKF